MANVDEYYILRNLKGTEYKFVSLIRMMTLNGKGDEEGWITLSYNQISMKLKCNISNLLTGLSNKPEVIEIKRSGKKDGKTMTKVRLNKNLLKYP